MLAFGSISLDDQGDYWCVAKNIKGWIRSSTVNFIGNKRSLSSLTFHSLEEFLPAPSFFHSNALFPSSAPPLHLLHILCITSLAILLLPLLLPLMYTPVFTPSGSALVCTPFIHLLFCLTKQKAGNPLLNE